MSTLSLPIVETVGLQKAGTSAGGSMRKIDNPLPQAVLSILYYSGTASSEPVPNQYLYARQTAASNVNIIFSVLPSTTETSQETLNKLKRLSGLTWEQLAKVLNVSRRSLHFWASGKPISPFNEEHLSRLLATIRYINRGSPDINRGALLQSQQGSTIPLDLLIAGKYEEVKRLLGAGTAVEKPKLKPLSPEVIASRLPPSPEDLVGALQDTIHREVGRSRPAKTTRSRKRSSGK
ncbi:MAG: XRE family transcriptional regulator [Acaryochloridaceae cyanobacterium RU_4_10]|nr:XRE family transcriptional regulator [Acaryochloridaceae cyanobacterium RU_4_10]